MIRKKLLLKLLILFSFSHVNSQELISTAGQENESNDISLSWSLGEVIIDHQAISEMDLFQGFHQTDIINEIKVDNNSQALNISITPNPSNGIFKIGTSEELGLSTFNLYNLSGQKVYSSQVHVPSTIDLSRFSGSVYLGQILNQKKSCTFKIIIL